VSKTGVKSKNNEDDKKIPNKTYNFETTFYTYHETAGNKTIANKSLDAE
jgi:hypothetical protein